MHSPNNSSSIDPRTMTTTSRRLSVASILNDDSGRASENRDTGPAATSSSRSPILPGNFTNATAGQYAIPPGLMRSSTPQPPRLGLQTFNSPPSTMIDHRHYPQTTQHAHRTVTTPPRSPDRTPYTMMVGQNQWERPASPSFANIPISLNYGPPSPPSPPSPSSRRAPLTSEAQRRILLENDPWIERSQLTPHSVVCRGCGRTLSLDKSPARKYYPGHWKHHRARCAAIQIKRETMGLPKIDDGYWDAYPSLR